MSDQTPEEPVEGAGEDPSVPAEPSARPGGRRAGSAADRLVRRAAANRSAGQPRGGPAAPEPGQRGAQGAAPARPKTKTPSGASGSKPAAPGPKPAPGGAPGGASGGASGSAAGNATSAVRAGKALKGAAQGAPAAKAAAPPGSTPQGSPSAPGGSRSGPAGAEAGANGKQVALGAAKTAANAAAGNTAGAVAEGVTTVAGTKTGKRLIGAIATVATALIAVVVMVPVAYIGAAQSDASSAARSSTVAAQDSGLDEHTISSAHSAVTGTGLPWQVAAALRLVPGDGEGTYGVDPAKADEAGVDTEDDAAVERWLALTLADTGVADSGSLLTGYVKGLDDTTGLPDGTMVLATSDAAERQHDDVVKAWVEAVASLPVGGADTAWATEVVDAAQRLSAGQEVCTAQTVPVTTTSPTPSPDTDTDTPAADGEVAPNTEAAASPEPDTTAEEPDADDPTQVEPAAVPAVDGFNEAQVRNASTIVAVAAELDVPRKGVVIALMTALQESRLKNYANSGENRRGYSGFPAPGTEHWLGVVRMSLDYPHDAVGNDADSVGVFQQRPSAGWGGPITDPPKAIMDNLMDVEFQARAFFGGPDGPLGPKRGLLALAGWEQMAPGDAAQRVQVSAFPDAYAKHENDANRLLDAVGDGKIFGSSGSTAATCGTTDASTQFSTPNPGSSDGVMNGGAWGGHQNGRIPLDALCPIPWHRTEQLRCDAAAALITLNDAYRADLGTDIAITDAYRDYQTQVVLKAQKGFLAATPGTSNHGWGLALDLGGGINTFTSASHLWMSANAPRYGWVNPNWARPGGGKEEPWHWEYVGAAPAQG